MGKTVRLLFVHGMCLRVPCDRRVLRTPTPLLKGGAASVILQFIIVFILMWCFFERVRFENSLIIL